MHGEHVTHLSRRDDDQPEYGYPALASHGVLDLPNLSLRAIGMADAAAQALERVLAVSDGFWIHFDADVLDPELMPAVDSPLAGGLSFEQAGQLLSPLVRHPAALGLQLTIYDPSIDPGHGGAGRLVQMLERAWAEA